SLVLNGGNMKFCKNEKCHKEFNPEPAWRLYCTPNCRNKCRDRRSYKNHRAEHISYAQVYLRTPKGRYRQFLGQQGYIGHTVSLTFEECCAMWSLPCHYCGGKISETGSGMDRVDSSLEY